MTSIIMPDNPEEAKAAMEHSREINRKLYGSKAPSTEDFIREAKANSLLDEGRADGLLEEAISLSDPQKVYLRAGQPVPKGAKVQRGPRGGKFFVPSGSGGRKARVFRVGGTVRDEFLGKKPHDVDYAVEIESFDHMREMIHELKGEIFQEREEFGCIRANIPGLGPADFTLCRKDGFYADGRRPESIESGSILDDLARRDFTVNAIAVDAETGEVVDPHGGRADLETGVLRAVGDPMARMREDSLRALRAVRFAATKGLVIHPSLRPALSDPEVIESLKKLPSERVYNEIEAMFRGANTLAAMDLLSEYPELREVVFSKIGLKPSLEPAFYHP